MINLTTDEKAALAAVDEYELMKLVDESLRNESAVPLNTLPLSGCGPLVSASLYRFSDSLTVYRQSKSAKKREQTRADARRAGSDLSHNLSAMKRRMEEEAKDGQFFYIDDHVHSPYEFVKKLEVRVSYRWRRSIEDDWSHGSIMFHHNFQSNPDYTLPSQTRKPSAAKQASDFQDELSRTWEHFKFSALGSVRDFFRDGGDGSTIPATFQAKADERTRGLNNYSTIFWERKKLF